MTVRSELPLAAEFPPASRERWRELVAGVLRKAGKLPEDYRGTVEDLLATTVAEGVMVAPLSTGEDGGQSVGAPGLAPFVRGARPLGASPDGWDVRQRHADPDVDATRAAVEADLANGARSLWLVVGAGALPVDALPTMLDGVDLASTPIALEAGPETERAAHTLLDLGVCRGTLGADPLGQLAGQDAETDVPAGLALAADLARCVRERPDVRAVTVDATAYHNTGADDAQELACSLAAGVAYLRALTEAGLPIADAVDQLEFRYAATADQFATLAKLRAARGLWARVTAECGVADQPQRQHAVSSEVMIAARDPWTNLLRATLAGFSAGVAGADAVTVLPFDAALGLPDSFSRRIARNTQSLLIAESHLARVVDPAGGSWYVERLTTELARRAWEVFTGIERVGGLLAALRDGSLAETLRATWAKRSERIARRAETVVGLNEFANLDERLPARRPDLRPASHGLLPRVRHGAAFEALRDRADAHEPRPAVFLAALGSPASHGARAGFARNLFQAGGLATPTAHQDVVAAFRAANTTVACLCGTDQAYEEGAAELAHALREAGAQRILLAGKPGTADADGYVYAGCDALEVLTDTLNRLGVRA